MSHTAKEVVEAAVGRPVSDEEAEWLLWEGSCFPLGGPRAVYMQIKHSARHGVCIGDPGATCGPNVPWSLGPVWAAPVTEGGE